MAIVKDQMCLFGQLSKTEPFYARITLYTRTWEHKEEPKDYYFFKTGPQTAISLDKRTKVHFMSDTPVISCVIKKDTA